MIFPGESVRISAKARDWQGTVLDDLTTDHVVLNINDKLTKARVVVDAPIEYDPDSNEFVGYWVTPREGEFRVTVTVQGKGGKTRSIEQRILKVAPDPTGQEYESNVSSPLPSIPVALYTGHGPPSSTAALPQHSLYIDLDSPFNMYEKE